MTETVRIPAAGHLLAGRLLNPPQQASQPAIIVAPQLAARTDPLAEQTAMALAARGWTVLLFDHSGFGASGGAPRQMRLGLQAQELRDVWWWMRRRNGIDGNRVGIWTHGLSAWRARLLVEHEPDLKALVMDRPVWRQRDWLLDPTAGFALLQAAGYFDDSDADPLLNPGWTLAWLNLLRAPLPKARRLPDVPLLVWSEATRPSADPCHAAMGHNSRCEWVQRPDPSQAARAGMLVPLARAAADSVLDETDAFFRQYL